jgi:hypothetical protein
VVDLKCRWSADGVLVEAVRVDGAWRRMQDSMHAFEQDMRRLVSHRADPEDAEPLDFVLTHLTLNQHWLQKES